MKAIRTFSAAISWHYCDSLSFFSLHRCSRDIPGGVVQATGGRDGLCLQAFWQTAIPHQAAPAEAARRLAEPPLCASTVSNSSARLLLASKTHLPLSRTLFFMVNPNVGLAPSSSPISDTPRTSTGHGPTSFSSHQMSPPSRHILLFSGILQPLRFLWCKSILWHTLQFISIFNLCLKLFSLLMSRNVSV